MDMEKTYGPKTVCRSVGISQRQLGYWTLIGVIKPTKQTHGSKIFNRFTDQDVETLRKVKQLTEEGFFVSKAAEKVHKETVQLEIAQLGMKINERGTDRTQARNHHGELSSSLYLEVALNEEIARIQQSYQPLSCIAIQVVFPPQLNFSPEKNRILFQLSNMLILRKEPSDVISYKREAIFLWLLPNRTLEQARFFSKEIKKLVEDPEWDIQGRKFKLTALFGSASHTFKSQKGLLAETEQDLTHQTAADKTVASIQNGTDGSYQPYTIGKNGSARH